MHPKDDLRHAAAPAKRRRLALAIAPPPSRMIVAAVYCLGPDFDHKVEHAVYPVALLRGVATAEDEHAGRPRDVTEDFEAVVVEGGGLSRESDLGSWGAASRATRLYLADWPPAEDEARVAPWVAEAGATLARVSRSQAEAGG